MGIASYSDHLTESKSVCLSNNDNDKPISSGVSPSWRTMDRAHNNNVCIVILIQWVYSDDLEERPKGS